MTIVANRPFMAQSFAGAAMPDGGWATSLPIPYAKGVDLVKALIPIIGGLLTFESESSPALGPSFDKALAVNLGDDGLDIGCVTSHGQFFFDQSAAAMPSSTRTSLQLHFYSS